MRNQEGHLFGSEQCVIAKVWVGTTDRRFIFRGQERRQIEELLRGGVQPVRAVIRALVLRQMDAGRTTVEAGAGEGISAKAAWGIGKRYLEGGLERAIYDAPRPGQKRLLDTEYGQRIIAMVCGPPAGRARWMVRLIAAEAVKRKLVEHVGAETVRILLQSHDLKPWSEKNVVRGGVGPVVHPPHGRRYQVVRKAAVG